MRRKTERSKTSSQSSPEKITRRSSRRGRKSPSKSPEPPQMEETIHEDDETEEPQNSSDSDSDSPIKSSKLSNKVKLDKRKRRQVEIEKENGDDKEKLGDERPVSLEEIKKIDKSVTPEPEPEVVFEAKDGNSTENKALIGKKESSPAKEKRKPLSRSKETVKRRSRSSSSSTSSSSSSASSTKSRNRRVSRDHKSVTPDRLSSVEARRARSDSSPEKSHSPEARKIEPIEIAKMPENTTILENSNQNVREGRSRSRRDSSADEKNIRDASKERARRSKSLTPGMRLIRRASTKSEDQPAKEIDPVLRKDSEISTPQEIIDDEMKENLPEEAVHIDKREAREFKNSISLESDKNDGKSQPTVRKRKWLSRKNSEHKPPILAISTDSLKNLISDVKPVPLSDVKLESSPEINRDEPMMVHAPAPHAKESRSSKSGSGNNTSKENSRQRKSSIEEVELDKSSGLKDESAPGQSISKNRKVSVMSEESLSPPKHELSNILYITNLVRPFTVLQLKGLLARTGKIVENGFWIDKIKSRCYVKYENEDEATETRHALHGVRWPTSNPKCLHVDFGTEIGFQKALDTTAEETQKLTDGRGGKMEKDFGWDKDIKDPYEKDKEAMVKPVREWDVGKKETGLDRTRDRERERSKERMRHDRKKRSPEREYPRDRERKRSHSASPARKFKKKENEPPLRLLDDLFRKTKATPCIYWLPLTAEQIAVKEEMRKKHMAEHQRRNEEIRKQEEEKDREREKDREKKRERDKEREREREKDREKNRDRSNDRRRDRSRSKERDGDRRRYR